MKESILNRALELYRQPFMALLYEAHTVHRAHHDPADIQKCTLLSVKTGGCPEDCSYCPQSAHYKTGVTKHDVLPLEEVRQKVLEAKNNGSQRFCMGAAWRNVKDGADFDQILEMVKIVKETKMEACATLGMLTPDQARRLKEAGLDAYNHNLDTSPDFYKEIISTRLYQDRLNTLDSVRKAGITVCCGGIVGMGESAEDRCALLAQLASLEPYPESVPINLLSPIEGTPLQDSEPVDPMDYVRLIAVARILMPESRVRLSAGRRLLSKEAQVLAFFAGANSIFLGEKLLTTANPDVSEDHALLKSLQPKEARESAASLH